MVSITDRRALRAHTSAVVRQLLRDLACLPPAVRFAGERPGSRHVDYAGSYLLVCIEFAVPLDRTLVHAAWPEPHPPRRRTPRTPAARKESADAPTPS